MTHPFDAAARLIGASLAAAGARPAVGFTYGFGTATGCPVGDVGPGADSTRTSAMVTVGASVSSTSSCFDYASRLLSATGANPVASVAYGAHANATTVGNVSVTYDGSDRVTGSTTTTTSGSQSFAYTLDVAGRMVKRTASGTGPGVENGTTFYGYTGGSDSLGVQLTGTGASAALGERYLSLPGGVVLTKRYANTGGDSWALTGLRGDTIATTDGAGVLTGSGFLYDPYGQPIDPVTGQVNPAATATTRTGGTTDAWLGGHQRGYEHTGGASMILMGARLYLPGLGQFTSTDPVYGGNANAYTYPADPINGFDLTGMDGWGVLSALITVAAVIAVAAVVVGFAVTCAACAVIALSADAAGAAMSAVDLGHAAVNRDTPTMLVDALSIATFGGGLIFTRLATVAEDEGRVTVLVKKIGKHERPRPAHRSVHPVWHARVQAASVSGAVVDAFAGGYSAEQALWNFHKSRG